MTKLPVLSGKKVLGLLLKAGFKVLDQRGSHVILIKENEDKKNKPVVPMHPVIKPGTLLSILRQAGLTREDLEELMKK